jgi:hypothetical protein
MATTGAQAVATESPTDDEVITGCSACAHPWTVHDQIAIRFCRATAAGRHHRSCVCTVRPCFAYSDEV